MIKFLLAGFLSGIISCFLTTSNVSQTAILFMPGLVFGVIIGFLIVDYNKRIFPAFIIFVIGSIFAYYAAVYLYLNFLVSIPFGVFIPGALGAGILLLLVSFLRKSFILGLFLFGILLGGVLALSIHFNVGNFSISSLIGVESDPIFALFITWQTGMAVFIGYHIKLIKRVT
jgi:hypothetical protein